MISVAHGGPLLGRRSQATRSFGVVVRVQRRRGVTDRQGVVERGLAPGLWMPSQTGDPGLRGSISSSRALLGGFDKLHARKPSLISNAADCSRRKVRCLSILGMWDRGSAMHGASHYRHSKPSTRQSHRPSLHELCSTGPAHVVLCSMIRAPPAKHKASCHPALGDVAAEWLLRHERQIQ
jgi:hypothetical protein